MKIKSPILNQENLKRLLNSIEFERDFNNYYDDIIKYLSQKKVNFSEGRALKIFRQTVVIYERFLEKALVEYFDFINDKRKPLSLILKISSLHVKKIQIFKKISYKIQRKSLSVDEGILFKKYEKEARYDLRLYEAALSLRIKLQIWCGSFSGISFDSEGLGKCTSMEMYKKLLKKGDAFKPKVYSQVKLFQDKFIDEMIYPVINAFIGYTHMQDAALGKNVYEDVFKNFGSTQERKNHFLRIAKLAPLGEVISKILYPKSYNNVGVLYFTSVNKAEDVEGYLKKLLYQTDPRLAAVEEEMLSRDACRYAYGLYKLLGGALDIDMKPFIALQFYDENNQTTTATSNIRVHEVAHAAHIFESRKHAKKPEVGGLDTILAFAEWLASQAVITSGQTKIFTKIQGKRAFLENIFDILMKALTASYKSYVFQYVYEGKVKTVEEFTNLAIVAFKKFIPWLAKENPKYGLFMCIAQINYLINHDGYFEIYGTANPLAILHGLCKKNPDITLDRMLDICGQTRNFDVMTPFTMMGTSPFLNDKDISYILAKVPIIIENYGK